MTSIDVAALRRSRWAPLTQPGPPRGSGHRRGDTPTGQAPM
ncbi:hypothetical protein [Verrucosispora sp. WMMD573]|nr:hypothetical protein [Verrucosispora sp. WMMD573]WBB56631.1 hypothetical protein O7601_11485 [Verrucosispora sp. WMMD573]